MGVWRDPKTRNVSNPGDWIPRKPHEIRWPSAMQSHGIRWAGTPAEYEQTMGVEGVSKRNDLARGMIGGESPWNKIDSRRDHMGCADFE
jgi:hypothetical protein